MPATSGRTSLTQFAFFDPDSSCWRTWPAISLWGSETYSATFPKRGSMRNGALYERVTSAPATSEPASSSLLPTPTTEPMTGSGHARHLGGEVKSLLPTPAAGNFNDGESVESWTARRDRLVAQHNNGNGMGTPLAMAVKMLPTPRTSDTNGPGAHGEGGSDLRTVVSLLPTPTTQNSHGNAYNSHGSDLLPGVAVKASNGGLTVPPSSDTLSQLAGLHPDQLTIEDA